MGAFPSPSQIQSDGAVLGRCCVHCAPYMPQHLINGLLYETTITNLRTPQMVVDVNATQYRLNPLIGYNV